MRPLRSRMESQRQLCKPTPRACGLKRQSRSHQSPLLLPDSRCSSPTRMCPQPNRQLHAHSRPRLGRAEVGLNLSSLVCFSIALLCMSPSLPSPVRGAEGVSIACQSVSRKPPTSLERLTSPNAGVHPQTEASAEMDDEDEEEQKSNAIDDRPSSSSSAAAAVAESPPAAMCDDDSAEGPLVAAASAAASAAGGSPPVSKKQARERERASIQYRRDSINLLVYWYWNEKNNSAPEPGTVPSQMCMDMLVGLNLFLADHFRLTRDFGSDSNKAFVDAFIAFWKNQAGTPISDDQRADMELHLGDELTRIIKQAVTDKMQPRNRQSDTQHTKRTHRHTQ